MGGDIITAGNSVISFSDLTGLLIPQSSASGEKPNASKIRERLTAVRPLGLNANAAILFISCLSKFFTSVMLSFCNWNEHGSVLREFVGTTVRLPTQSGLVRGEWVVSRRTLM